MTRPIAVPAPPSPWETTFRTLAVTANLAAVDVLAGALDSPRPEAVHGAVAALVERREERGAREILRRWHKLDERCRALVAERPLRMTQALRDGLLSDDPALRRNACDAARRLCEYDVMAALTALAESNHKADADLAADVIVELTQFLYDELTGQRAARKWRDPQRAREHVLAALEQSAARYARHRRPEILEALLILAPRDNAALRRFLSEPLDPCHAATLAALRQSPRPGVVRLAMSFLDDPHASLAALRIVLSRDDEAFLQRLLRRMSEGPSARMRANLARIDEIPWLSSQSLMRLEEGAQRAALDLADTCGIDRQRTFELFRAALAHGAPPARRLAAERLRGFRGAQADQLTMALSEDRDPAVRAAAVRHLRRRAVPGAVARLVESLDDIQECVREAAQQGLGDVSFDKYLASFDLLDAAARASAGALVHKIDPQAPARLMEELKSPVRTRRLRGLEMAMAMGAAHQVEARAIELLHEDDDYLVRAAAARALAPHGGPQARQALEEALLDRSAAVRQAAETALASLAQAPLGAEPADWEQVIGSWNAFADGL